MPEAPETVLGRKVVKDYGKGGVLEWLCVEKDTPDGLKGIWEPRLTKPDGKITKPGWAPLPGSQFLFLESPVFETLYSGSRGPGKSTTLLMDYASGVGRGWGKAWRGIVFRRKYGDLDDLVKKAEDLFGKLYGPKNFRFIRSKSDYKAEWTSGEALLFRHMFDVDDYEDYHGHEYPWIGWEELTQWADGRAYLKMMSCCRASVQGIPCKVRSTTNAYGVGRNWVKRRFRLPEGYGKVIRIPGEMPRVAIRGMMHENFVLLAVQPNYDKIVAQAATNPAQRKAWLHDDWTVTAGGMIDDIWRNDVHVVPDIPVQLIPRGWKITRSYDHGQSSPFSVGWWLQSNGEPVKYQGRLIGAVRGDLILWKEWYGTTGGDNEGVLMSATKIAQGILDREEDEGIKGRVIPGPADNQIWSKDSRGTGLSPVDDFNKEGVYWERADQSPNSRKRGWEMLRTALEHAIPEPNGVREKPGLFVCEGNHWWLELMPPMPRQTDDPDEVADGYEDHIADMTRYRVTWSQPENWRKGF